MNQKPPFVAASSASRPDTKTAEQSTFAEPCSPSSVCVPTGGAAAGATLAAADNKNARAIDGFTSNSSRMAGPIWPRHVLHGVLDEEAGTQIAAFPASLTSAELCRFRVRWRHPKYRCARPVISGETAHRR